MWRVVPKGQRPSRIPTYGIAIGIGHRHEWRAESPVSYPGFVAATDGSGLQPPDLSFADQNLGRWPRLGWQPTVGAGEWCIFGIRASCHAKVSRVVRSRSRTAQLRAALQKPPTQLLQHADWLSMWDYTLGRRFQKDEGLAACFVTRCAGDSKVWRE